MKIIKWHDSYLLVKLLVIWSRKLSILMIQSQAESAETCVPTYLTIVQWLCNPYVISHIVSSPNCQSYLVYLKIYLISDLLLDNDCSNELGDGVENIKSIFGGGTCLVSWSLFIVLVLYMYMWPQSKLDQLNWCFANEFWQQYQDSWLIIIMKPSLSLLRFCGFSSYTNQL